VYLADGSMAPGFKSIHFGSPNEYAFEYLMSGGDNSLHLVMGLRKPNERGELSLKSKPYAGKFFMSGAAAGRVYLFDPEVRLDPAQYHGNVPTAISAEEWMRDVGPFLAREAKRRGAPIRVEGEHVSVRLEGHWASLALRRSVSQARADQGGEGGAGSRRGAASARADRRRVATDPLVAARRDPLVATRGSARRGSLRSLAQSHETRHCEPQAQADHQPTEDQHPTFWART
jgi:hypothetical protein